MSSKRMNTVLHSKLILLEGFSKLFKSGCIFYTLCMNFFELYLTFSIFLAFKLLLHKLSVRLTTIQTVQNVQCK